MSVKDKDMGYQAIIRELNSLKRRRITVGILSDTGQHPSGDASVAEVGFFNEFGTQKIPPRPFISTSFDDNLTKYERSLANGVKRIGRTMSADKIADRLGAKMSADVKRKIVAIRNPPNAPSTVASKGSSNPLIDTGRMRQSITYQVDKTFF